MDLTSHYPRSPRVILWGFVHLARMIDKCRAVQEGTLGEYFYPCPMDTLLLDFLGVSAEDFLQNVRDQDEPGIITWLSLHATTHTQDEISKWNEGLLARGPDNEEKRAYFSECLARVAPTRADITSWADLLDIEEGRPIPLRSSHSV